MSEQQQLLAMLDRAGIGYGCRVDCKDGQPVGESVQVESAEADERGKWWVTEFHFDESGTLKHDGVVTYPGQEG